MNVVSILGGKVHLADVDSPVPFPLCSAGSRNTVTRYRGVTGDVDCKECCGILNRRAERLAREAKGESEAMAANDINSEEGRKVVEEINANIERARSLADDDARRALKEETETLISSLSGKGSIATKKDLRAGWNAAEAKALENEAAALAVRAAEDVASATDYSVYKGVVELVNDGAAKVAEAVRTERAGSTLAWEIAKIGLDICRRLPRGDGLPDIVMDSDRAKQALKDLYAKAGESFDDGFDNKEAFDSLKRKVQYRRSDVRAEYLRNLDSDDQEAVTERERYAPLLKSKPDDVPVSEWVAKAYKTSTKGERELKAERYRRKQLEAAGESVPEDESSTSEAEQPSPDEKIKTVVASFIKDIKRAAPQDFENASEEAKAKARTELLKIADAVKAMISATL